MCVVDTARRWEKYQLTCPHETDQPTIIAEALTEFVDTYLRKGHSPRDAELLARSELGQTLAEAGGSVGVTRQRAHQIQQAA